MVNIAVGVHAVVLDDGAATHRNSVDKCNYCIRNLVLLRVGTQPGQHNFNRVMAPTPPLIEDPVQLLPGAPGTPRVVALGMSLSVALS